MYLPIASLLAARQLEGSAAPSNAARSLSKANSLLSRQNVAFIPKTNSPEEQAFEAAQAASVAAAAKETACAIAASAGLPCSREVRRELVDMIATASGISSRQFISSPQRRQNVAVIPPSGSPEEQAAQAAQAESVAKAAAETACMFKAAAGLPCSRELPQRRQNVAVIPPSGSPEELAAQAAQAESAAKAAAETACMFKAAAGLPCSRELPQRRQNVAVIPPSGSPEEQAAQAAQAESVAKAAAETACMFKAAAGLPCSRELLESRQNVAVIPPSGSPEEQAAQAAQAESVAKAAAKTACIFKAAAGLPCPRDIAQSIVRSLVASLD
ncbi:hypothetical protein DL96DRAFT_1559945 [Flagelloscypha sp. PMI_526]|nr:hypothetical protein DL96DRAFT_1559945 [Flagelloscypha sp. PMI_526]